MHILSIFILFIFSLMTLSGCQQTATKITSQAPQISQISQMNQGPQGNMTAEKIMADHPVILDVRSPFEFNLSHVPDAINVRWEDFSQADPRYRGLLQTDHFALARRLSLIGIDPSSKVVVLGKGRQGRGEEGRVAWTLEVLGVSNVHTMNHTLYRAMNPKEDPAPVQNKPYWKPTSDESLNVSLEQFKAFATQQLPPWRPTSRARAKALGGIPAGALEGPAPKIFGLSLKDAAGKVVVLDVRSPEEFSLHNLGQNLAQNKDIKVPVVNLEWSEFFDDKGIPTHNVDKLLAEKGLQPGQIILVISNHGVRSGAVTYALRRLGYLQSANFAGGYEGWK